MLVIKSLSASNQRTMVDNGIRRSPSLLLFLAMLTRFLALGMEVGKKDTMTPIFAGREVGSPLGHVSFVEGDMASQAFVSLSLKEVRKLDVIYLLDMSGSIEGQSQIDVNVPRATLALVLADILQKIQDHRDVIIGLHLICGDNPEDACRVKLLARFPFDDALLNRIR